MKNLYHYIERHSKKQQKLSKVNFSRLALEYDLVTILLAEYNRKMATLRTRKKIRFNYSYVGTRRYYSDMKYWNVIGFEYKKELILRLPKKYIDFRWRKEIYLSEIINHDVNFSLHNYVNFDKLYLKLNQLRNKILGKV